MTALVIVIVGCAVHVLVTWLVEAPDNEYCQGPQPRGVVGSLAAGGLASIALIASAVL
jgi:hypothetical protein